MIILGLVELGGSININEPINGYIFHFSDKNPQALELRGYWRMQQLFNNLEESPEVRLVVNYHDKITLAVGIKLLYLFSHKMGSCYILFENGEVMKLL